VTLEPPSTKTVDTGLSVWLVESGVIDFEAAA
jgi:hypothetical protein